MNIESVLKGTIFGRSLRSKDRAVSRVSLEELRNFVLIPHSKCLKFLGEYGREIRKLGKNAELIFWVEGRPYGWFLFGLGGIFTSKLFGEKIGFSTEFLSFLSSVEEFIMEESGWGFHITVTKEKGVA